MAADSATNFRLLAQLPDYLVGFYIENSSQLLALLSIVAALDRLRVVLTVLITLNDIPLLAPTFELIWLLVIC